MTNRRLRAARALALLLPLLALPRGLAGQAAHLARDIETAVQRSASPSDPANLFTAGSKVLFTAEAGSSPTQLWASDGTPAGTEQLTGACPEGCSVQPLGTLGGVAVFGLGAYPEALNEIWRSDGTRRGTFPLTGGALGPSGSLLTAVAGGILYFTGCTATECGLARTDGTVAGTLFLHGVADSVHGLAALGGKAYFATVGELWVSDGTVAGTRAIAAVPNSPLLLTAAAHRLFFVAPYFASPQLWTSDGTAAGTRQLTHLAAPNAFGQTAGFKVAGDRVYFVADDVTHGAEIWTSDGTPAGTRAVTDFGFFDPFGFADREDPGNALLPSQLEVLGSRLLFTATDGISPVKVWTTDGSPASTAPLADLTSSLYAPLLRLGGRVLFHAGGGLWATDGTAAGTVRLHDAIADGPFPLLGGAVFSVPGAKGVTLWTTDGTPAGTRRLNAAPLALPFTLPTLDATRIAAAGGKLFVVAETGAPPVFGSEPTGLWASDGGPGGGRFVVSSETATASSDPHGLAALGSQVFFRARRGSSTAVWRSAGDEASTVPATDELAFDGDPGDAPTAAGGKVFFWHLGDNLRPQLWSADGAVPAAVLTRFATGRYPDPPPRPTSLGAKVFFALRPAAGDVELWSSDGTAAGTARALDLPGATWSSSLGAVGTRLFFLAETAGDGVQVWTSDGTVAGTREVSATADLSRASDPRFTAAGPLAFFRTDRAVWRTDGTAGGTLQVYPPEGFAGEPVALAELGGALYFLVKVDFDAAELWRSDGTPAGTARVAGFYGRGFFGESFEMVGAAGRLFLAVADGDHGLELWTSDGTSAGTALVRDIASGPASSQIAGLTAAGSRVFFSADDGVHGAELWVTDGTAAGTRLAADVAPAALPSNPQEITAAGDRLYFSADDGLHGRELWVLPLAGPPGCAPSAERLCLAGGRFEVAAEWRDFQGNTGRGTAVGLTADTGYFWFFNPANVEVVAKVLDGRGVNQAFWVFYGALSSVEYTLTVTDTRTGLTRRYFNPAGALASLADTRGFGPLGAFDTQRPRAAAPSSPTLVSARTEPRAATGSCAAGPGRLCLAGRFAVTAAWKDFQGHSGTGTAAPLTGDTGYFWFFDPANVEVVAKVVDGRAVNQKFWLFYGALSSVEYTLTVTDTTTGAVKEYRNSSGNLASVADTGAF